MVKDGERCSPQQGEPEVLILVPAAVQGSGAETPVPAVAKPKYCPLLMALVGTVFGFFSF